MRLTRVSYRMADGSMRQSKNWYVDFIDHEHKRHAIAAFPDRAQSARFGDQIEHLVILRSSGDPLDPPSLRWFKRLPEWQQRRLAKLGLVASRAEPPGLLTFLKTYQQSLIDRGMRPADAREAASRCRRTIKALDAKLIDDLTPTAVQGYLARRRRGGLSATTSNHYLKQLKAFGNWLVREGKANTNPLAHIQRVTEVKDTQRAFTPDELDKLLGTTYNGPTRYGLTGRQRYWLYRFAVETGLRAGEIRALKPTDFDWQAGTVTIRPQAGRLRPKVRKLVKQPLRQSTAAELRGHLHNESGVKAAGIKNADRAFKVPVKSATMLALDLIDAGIPREDAEGRVLVFHSLRHTFGTNLIAAGVDLVVIQKLMRHASIQMTIDRYGHLPSAILQEAVECIPRLQGSSMKKEGYCEA